jgi:hypothetical protein
MGKPTPDPSKFRSGQEAAEHFDALVRRVISVPRAVVVEKQQALKRQAVAARAKRRRKTG